LIARVPVAWIVGIGTVLSLLVACATPAQRAHRTAQESGYIRLELQGDPFGHIAFFKAGEPAATLHVYVEHDGTPWATPTRPAEDPTPRRPLMLEAMATDLSPVLYLGRPCYFGLSTQAPCETVWWTHRRFSAQVVRSMAAALSRFLATHPGIESVELYGFSGGGVVAALMAHEVTATRRLVTIAAPLDLDAWTRRHRYTELVGSLSPLRQSPLPANIAQLHLVGATDDVVTQEMVRPFVERQGNAELRVVAGFDHYCCWEASWTRLVLQQ
jgi:pimeloyl-ACP methyl ester carboxylesterase